MSIHVVLLPTEEDGISAAVAGDACDLDERDVEVAEDAFGDHLRDVRQVYIHVVQQPRVDLAAGHRVGLVGHSGFDPAAAASAPSSSGAVDEPVQTLTAKRSPRSAASVTRVTSAAGTAS